MKKILFAFSFLIANFVLAQNAGDYNFTFVNSTVDGTVDIYISPPNSGSSYGFFMFNPNNWFMESTTLGDGINYDTVNRIFNINYNKVLEKNVLISNSLTRSLSINCETTQVFDGTTSTATWTFPLLTGTTPGKMIIIKNTGSQDLNIEPYSGDGIYETSLLASTVIYPGGWAIFIASGDYWVMLQS